MPTDAEVEAAARAMFDSFQETQDAHLRRDTWDSQHGLALQPYHRAAARAALEAAESVRKEEG